MELNFCLFFFKLLFQHMVVYDEILKSPKTATAKSSGEKKEGSFFPKTACGN